MINLILGDCLERMKDIPDGSVDMVLTDPPYGTTACKWDSIIPLEPMWEQLTKASPFAIGHAQSWTLPNFNAAQELEKRIHKRLAHLNAQYEGFDGATEWFEVSPTVAIKEITKVVNNSQQLALI